MRDGGRGASDVCGGFPNWKQLPERLLEACRAHDALSEEAIATEQGSP